MSVFDELLNVRLEKGGRHRRLAGLADYGPRFLRLHGSRELPLLNFSSNDYLGLSRCPLESGGGSQPSSRLLSGDLAEHQECERRLADWLGREACLIYPTGYMANLGLVSAIAERGDRVLMDRLCHASLLDGARLSWARTERHKHLDLEDLEKRLKAVSGAGAIWVITESVFSMDGDSPDFSALAGLKKKYGFFLVVDEAHAMGVHGKEGRGLLDACGVSELADVVSFTLSKAFAMQGGVIAGSARLKEFLVNRSRPFIFTTAMPAGFLKSAPDRLAKLRGADKERGRLESLSRQLAEGLGLTRNQWSAIVPVIFGSGSKARSAAGSLGSQGIFCPAILPPTVPEGAARLRISLNATHESGDIDRLLYALENARSCT